MKKILAILLTAFMLLSIAACEKNDVTDTPDTEEGTEEMTNEENTDPVAPPENGENNDDGDTDKSVTVALNKSTEGIKHLGVRTLLSDAQINCDHSGSGIEFVLNNESSTITIDAVSSGPCRFKVFVNGELHMNYNEFNEDFFEIFGESVIKLNNLPLGDITVRVVKLTEQALATAELTKLTFTGTLRKNAPESKELYIEFIGGSETVGSALSGGSGYTAQDVTLAYSYLLAEKMNADYSITCIKNLIASKNSADAIAQYELSSPRRDGEAKYDFARKADVVVIDLGAVDASNTSITAEAFSEKYVELLRTVRQKNGETCKIVCIYDSSMGEFEAVIQNACRNEMGGQTEGVYLCKRNGGSTDNSVTFINSLKNIVEAAINGILTEKELQVGENGEGLKVDIKNDFVTIN